MLNEDTITLGPDCHEVCLTQQDIPEITTHDLCMVGYCRLQPPYSVARRDPDHHTLLFTIRGEGRLHTRKSQHVIGPNSITLLPAHHPFRFDIEGDCWDMVWISLNPMPAWNRIAQSHQDVWPCQQAVPLYHLIGMLHHEINGDLSARREIVALMINYLRLALTDNTEHKKRRQLKLLFWHLDAQLHHPWTVEKLAGYMHCSAPHFHRLCHQEFGWGPIQQLIHMRMERAKLLLMQTDWNIQEIAERVGYGSVFSFSNLFKKRTGMAPSFFRKEFIRGR